MPQLARLLAFLKNFISNGIHQLTVMALCAICLAALSYLAGISHARRDCKQQQTQAAAAAQRIAASAATAMSTVAETSAATQTEIRTVFKDRIIKQYVEVPRETIARPDAACTVPNRFVSLWNSANRAELPTNASLFDEAASGVALSDIGAQHEAEAELCHANTEQLKALQAAEKARQLATQAATP